MSHFVGENKSSWTDMSNYVVHFAKDYNGKSAYDNMLSILHQRVIKARNPFGLARAKAPDPKTQRAACFSEIPLHLLKRLAEARSQYGIVFKKEIVIHRGANPIMHAYKDHDMTAALKEIVTSAKDNPDHPIWRVTPFVDAPGSYGKRQQEPWIPSRVTLSAPSELRLLHLLPPEIVPPRLGVGDGR